MNCQRHRLPTPLLRRAYLSAEALVAMLIMSVVVIAVGKYAVTMGQVLHNHRLRHDALSRASDVMEQLMSPIDQPLQQRADEIVNQSQSITPEDAGDGKRVADSRFKLTIDIRSETLAGQSGQQILVRVAASDSPAKQLAVLQGWVPDR